MSKSTINYRFEVEIMPRFFKQALEILNGLGLWKEPKTELDAALKACNLINDNEEIYISGETRYMTCRGSYYGPLNNQVKILRKLAPVLNDSTVWVVCRDTSNKKWSISDGKFSLRSI